MVVSALAFAADNEARQYVQGVFVVNERLQTVPEPTVMTTNSLQLNTPSNTEATSHPLVFFIDFFFWIFLTKSCRCSSRCRSPARRSSILEWLSRKRVRDAKSPVSRGVHAFNCYTIAQRSSYKYQMPLPSAKISLREAMVL